jgi:hypothetical protein
VSLRLGFPTILAEMPIANVAGTRECGTSGQGELSTHDSQ